MGTDGSKWTSSSVTLNNAGDAVDVDWNDPVDGDYVDTLKEYSVKPVLSWSSLTSTSTGDYTVYVTGFTGSSGASSYFGFSGQKSSEAKTYTISPVSFILRSIKLDGKTSLGFDYDGDSKYPTNIAIDAYTATTDTKNAEWVATREQSGKYTVTATNGKDDSSDPQDIYAGKSSGEAGTAGVAISKITIEVNDAGDDEFKLPGRYKVTVQMGKDFGGESISATYTIKGSIK